jgi:hypothetical protein
MVHPDPDAPDRAGGGLLMGFPAGLWGKVPGKVRMALAALAAMLVAGVALFFKGKRAGEVQAESEAALILGKKEADEVHRMAREGDDEGVQKALADARAKARKVTGLIVALCVLWLSGGPILAGSKDVYPEDVNMETECSHRPDWCRPGFVCLPTACAADDAAKLFLLSSQVEALKLKAKRGHFHLMGATCGPAASLSVDSGQTTFAGTISCAVGLTITP